MPGDDSLKKSFQIMYKRLIYIIQKLNLKPIIAGHKNLHFIKGTLRNGGLSFFSGHSL